MFIQNVSEWISDGTPTKLVEDTLNELNSSRWISSLPENGWVLIGEKFPYGVCAFYDDGKYPNKTIYEIKENENFIDFGIPQSYACWIIEDPYIYEAFTRKLYRDSSVSLALLFLAKCYVSNRGENLVAPALMSEDADMLYKNFCNLYGEPYKMDRYHIVPMPEKLFTPFGGKYIK
jgi:hypothetical protein